MTDACASSSVFSSAPYLESCLGHELRWLHGEAKTPAMRAALSEFWLQQEAVKHPTEAWRRTFDATVVALDVQGAVVGVSTVYHDVMRHSGQPYWFYWTFVHPEHRIGALARRMLGSTYAGLARSYGLEPGAPEGLITVMENPRLNDRGPGLVMRRERFMHIGEDPAGHRVWCRRFDGATP